MGMYRYTLLWTMEVMQCERDLNISSHIKKISAIHHEKIIQSKGIKSCTHARLTFWPNELTALGQIVLSVRY